MTGDILAKRLANIAYRYNAKGIDMDGLRFDVRDIESIFEEPLSLSEKEKQLSEISSKIETTPFCAIRVHYSPETFEAYFSADFVGGINIHCTEDRELTTITMNIRADMIVGRGIITNDFSFYDYQLDYWLNPILPTLEPPLPTLEKPMIIKDGEEKGLQNLFITSSRPRWLFPDSVGRFKHWWPDFKSLRRGLPYNKDLESIVLNEIIPINWEKRIIINPLIVHGKITEYLTHQDLNEMEKYDLLRPEDMQRLRKEVSEFDVLKSDTFSNVIKNNGGKENVVKTIHRKIEKLQQTADENAIALSGKAMEVYESRTLNEKSYSQDVEDVPLDIRFWFVGDEKILARAAFIFGNRDVESDGSFRLKLPLELTTKPIAEAVMDEFLLFASLKVGSLLSAEIIRKEEE